MSNPRYTSDHLRQDAYNHPQYELMQDKLNAYLAQFTAVEEQGSVAWRMQRALHQEDGKVYMTIGGSELATLFGLDKFRSELKMLFDKAHFLVHGCDPDEERDHSATSWGHTTEQALANFVGKYFGTDHFALEASVPHRSLRNFRYSPDGFVILRFTGEIPSTAEDAEPGDIEEFDELVVAVLELKNPFGRVVKGEKIPSQYASQMLSGMDTFSDMCAVGLFVEANWSIQSLAQVGQAKYNPRVNPFLSITGKFGKDRFNGLELIDSCLIGFYPTAEPQDGSVVVAMKRHFVDNGLWNQRHGVFDVGNADKAIFGIIMTLVATGQLKSRESSFLRRDNCSLEMALAELRQGAKDPAIFVMNIGLMKLAWYLSQANPNYVESQRPHIERFVAKLERKVAEDGGLHPMFRGGTPPVKDGIDAAAALMANLALEAAEKKKNQLEYDD